MSDETPEPDEDRIVVRANGREFFGWTSVQIEPSIEMAARPFALTVSGVYATDAGFLVEGDDVEIRAGEDLVCTGWIDRLEHTGDAEGASVQITGRSQTCDIVDCSARVGAWRGL